MTPDVVDTEVGTPEAAVPETTTETPLQPQFTSHADGAEISTRGFTLSGQTQPNATVDIQVDSRTAVAGGFVNLGSSNLVDTTVTADVNGEFSVQVPVPLVVNSNTVYEVEAFARMGDQISPTTQLTLQQQ